MRRRHNLIDHLLGCLCAALVTFTPFVSAETVTDLLSGAHEGRLHTAQLG